MPTEPTKSPTETDREEAMALSLEMQRRLSDEGRHVEVGIVIAMRAHINTLLDRIQELEEAAAGAVSSRGKERAAAAGETGEHRHKYGPDGKCVKVAGGKACQAMNRRARALKNGAADEVAAEEVQS